MDIVVHTLAPTLILGIVAVAVDRSNRRSSSSLSSARAWFVSDLGVDAAVGAVLSSAADRGPMTFEFRREPTNSPRKEARTEKCYRFEYMCIKNSYV